MDLDTRRGWGAEIRLPTNPLFKIICVVDNVDVALRRVHLAYDYALDSRGHFAGWFGEEDVLRWLDPKELALYQETAFLNIESK